MSLDSSSLVALMNKAVKSEILSCNMLAPRIYACNQNISSAIMVIYDESRRNVLSGIKAKVRFNNALRSYREDLLRTKSIDEEKADRIIASALGSIEAIVDNAIGFYLIGKESNHISADFI